MKLISTTKLLSCIVAMLFSIIAIAQPANDNVCDAIDLTGGGSSGVIDNAGATVQADEADIAPPIIAGCAPGGWCDPAGDDGSTIDNSIWFKFDAPTAGSVTISGCLSNFDTQIAVYEVGDCSDFSTFTFIWGTDDIEDCGVLDDGSTTGLSSEMTLECLTGGQSYYILLDGWDNDDPDVSVPNGFVDLSLEEITPTGDAATIESITATAPICMGGADGSAVAVVTGPPPYTFAWSTGDEGLSISDLAAGDYTFTVTDACGVSTMETVSVPDGPAPSQIVTTISDNAVVHPTDCGDDSIESNNSGSDGQISLGVSSGTPPFTMVWSTGDTTAFLSGLAAGDYTVTVYDGCGNPPAVETFTLTATAANSEPAGADVEITCGDTTEIGGAGLGVLSQLNTDTGLGTLSGNIACRAGGFFSDNKYFRAFELDDDFGLSGPVQIEGVDFLLFAEAAAESGGLQPVDFKLHTADVTDLSVAVLTEIASVSMMVPDIPDYDFFRAPVKATVDASEILVVELSHPGGTIHRFDPASIIPDNVATFPQPTYLSSVGCGLTPPAPMTMLTPTLSFDNQILMNIIYRDTSGDTYAWDDPNGDLSATDVANPNLTVNTQVTYTLTVTDACGNQVIDDVLVDCEVGIIAPEDAVFTISPNPSNGIFLLQNTDVAQNMALQIFDLQGKMMQAEQFNGTSHTIDLSAYAAGVYVLKLDNGVDVELHKLMVY